MKEVDQLGIERVLRLALDAISIRDKELHVSFDVDSIDPQVIPSTGNYSMNNIRRLTLYGFLVFEESRRTFESI